MQNQDKKLNTKNLKEVIAEIVKKYEESPYIIVKGQRIQKTLKQYIPYTTEEWEKEMEKRKGYKDQKDLNSFIDKVFFEDGALQLEKWTNKYKHGRHT